MLNPQILEKSYQGYIRDPGRWIQDGIIEVNLELLKQFNLNNITSEEEKDLQAQFPFYFHVIETDEKVTLFNNQFAVWIVPQIVEEIPTTLTLIALVQDENPRLEIAFSTSGAYNTPKYVLKILRHFLTEVLDTEEEIATIWPH